MKILENKWERYLFQIPEEKATLRVERVRFCGRSADRFGCFDPKISCFGLLIDALNDTYKNRCYIKDRKLIYNREQPKTG